MRASQRLAPRGNEDEEGLVLHEADGEFAHELAVAHGAGAVVGFLEVAEIAEEDGVGAGGFADDFVHAGVGGGMVAGDVAGEHEAAAVEAVHEVEVVVGDDAGEEVTGEVAAFDVEAVAVADEAVEAAEADGVAEAGVEDPEEVAVLMGIVVFAVATEADGVAFFAEQPFGEFAGVHFAAVAEGFFGEGVEAGGEIGSADFPAGEEGGELGESFFELGGGGVDPAPAHPGVEEFVAADGVEHAGDEAVFLDGEGALEAGEVEGEVRPHGGEFFLHGFADDFGVVVEEAEEIVQIGDARHVKGEYHRWGVGCKAIVCAGACNDGLCKAGEAEGLGGFGHFVVEGDEVEFGDDGNGAVKDEEVAGVGGAEAEGAIEGAEGGE